MSVPFTYPDERRVQRISLVGSLAFHLLLIILLSLLVVWKPKEPELIELDWAGSSGAPNQSLVESEANPSKEKESMTSGGSMTKEKMELPVAKNPSEETIPGTKKLKAIGAAGTKRDKVVSQGAAKSRRRAQDGIAGGAGTSTGYSIEWSGTGSRRLLSGRIPKYPEGTDKEFPVLLQFNVLPDGSVTGILPLKRSDELLEREAISALRTWRFDPLPPQFQQTTQTGRIMFTFKLE